VTTERYSEVDEARRYLLEQEVAGSGVRVSWEAYRTPGGVRVRITAFNRSQRQEVASWLVRGRTDSRDMREWVATFTSVMEQLWDRRYGV
jgi:hypothetical protein